MKHWLINTMKEIKQLRAKISSNVVVLFLSGFFFSQFMLLNILYTKNPSGGWVTNVGTIKTSFLLFTVLIALSLCLAFLWRMATSREGVKKIKMTKANIVKMKPRYSPIDYPRGSISPVISSYAIA